MADIAKIEWNDSYILNVPEIDLQHKKLVNIMNELYDVAVGPEEEYKTKMPIILKKLTDYTVYHFTCEESLQKGIGYTGCDTHKNTHDCFVKEVQYQIKKLTSADKNSILNLYKYLVSWLFTHIGKADKAWADFKKQKEA